MTQQNFPKDHVFWDTDLQRNTVFPFARRTKNVDISEVILWIIPTSLHFHKVLNLSCFPREHQNPSLTHLMVCYQKQASPDCPKSRRTQFALLHHYILVFHLFCSAKLKHKYLQQCVRPPEADHGLPFVSHVCLSRAFMARKKHVLSCVPSYSLRIPPHSTGRVSQSFTFACVKLDQKH